MESKQQTPSVILKLMGFDNMNPQHKNYVRDRPKVLSEDYLQKVAAIGVRKKRLSYYQHHEKEESDDVSKVVKTIRRDKNHNPSNVEGVPQELLDDDLVRWKPEIFTSLYNRETCAKANPGNRGIGFKYSSLRSSCKDSYMSDGLLKEIVCPKSTRLYPEMRNRKEMNFRKNQSFAKSYDMPKPASNVSMFSDSNGSYVGPEGKSQTLEKRDVTEKLQEVGQQGHDSTHQRGNGTSNLSRQSGFCNGKSKRNIRCKVGVNYSFARQVPMARPLCAASDIANNCAIKMKDDLFQKYWGLRKNASANWSTQKSKKQNINLNGNDTEENCVVLHNLKKRRYRMNLSDKKHVLSRLSSSGPSPAIIECQLLQQTCLMDEDVENNKHGDSNMSKQSAVARDSSVDCSGTDAKVEVVSWLHNNLTKQQSESKATFMTDGDSDSLIHTSYASMIQDIPEMQEDSAYSLCTRGDTDSTGSLQEENGPSPVSVLDPIFREDISCISESGSGVSDSSEVDDEGLGLNVSSDEDCGDSEKKKDIVGISRTEESRDFSYVVEVLTEAGISNKNLFKDFFSAWNSEECPISPRVFEILEKKFGEQQHWKRSERRLLFDRINFGLLEILQPNLYVPKWEKLLSRRVNVKPSQDMIEEEIWGLLVSQEKKGGKDLVDDMLGGEIRWIEIGEDVEDIVKEIVKMLVEELVDEIVRLEDFLEL